MNERIKELAEQAGVTGYFAAGTELATPIPLSAEMGKFAELIVNDCILAVRKADHRHAITTWDLEQFHATLEKAERSILEKVMGKVYAD